MPGFSLLFEEEALAVTKSGPIQLLNSPEIQTEVNNPRLEPESILSFECLIKSRPSLEEKLSILKDWIRQGAKWEEHWLIFPFPKPSLPEFKKKKVFSPAEKVKRTFYNRISVGKAMRNLQ